MRKRLPKKRKTIVLTFRDVLQNKPGCGPSAMAGVFSRLIATHILAKDGGKRLFFGDEVPVRVTPARRGPKQKGLTMPNEG